MQDAQAQRRAHWEAVFETKAPDGVSWFQRRPDLSLKLIHRTGVARDAAIVDVGAGASNLVDHLLDDGFANVAALDLAEPALDLAKKRMQNRAFQVEWIVADIAHWRPTRAFDLWHDRAAFHFLTDPADQLAYAHTLNAALKPDGWAIIAGFAPDGPQKCSGFDIVRHDAASLDRVLGRAFKLMETHGEIHVTPTGAEQAFRYHIFQRKG